MDQDQDQDLDKDRDQDKDREQDQDQDQDQEQQNNNKFASAEKLDAFSKSLKVGETVGVLQSFEARDSYPQPPSLLNEVSLISYLEKKGIGRPSTFATMVNIVQDRNYVIQERKLNDHDDPPKKDCAAPRGRARARTPDVLVVKVYMYSKGGSITEREETKKVDPKQSASSSSASLVITPLGKEMLRQMNKDKMLAQILDERFTSNMESNLDLISSGKEEYNHVVHDMYKDFGVVFDGIKAAAAAARPGTKKGILLGDHEGSPIHYAPDGKYGPYLKWKSKCYKVTATTTPQNLSLQHAIEIISAAAAASSSDVAATAAARKTLSYRNNPVIIHPSKFKEGEYYVTYKDKHYSIPKAILHEGNLESVKVGEIMKIVHDLRSKSKSKNKSTSKK